MQIEPIAARTSPILEINEVHCGYGQKEIVRGISVSIGTNEVIAILGANGAGKSTLLKAVVGLVDCSHGEVLLSRTRMRSLRPDARVRLGLSYLPQKSAVFRSLTVRENLEMALSPVPKVEWAQRISETLEWHPELLGLLGARAGVLSGGQRQLLGVAMALVRRPSVVLLDEPSSGLAPVLATQILQRTVQHAKSSGAAVIIVEQRREVLSYAGRAVLLREGRIRAETFQPSEWMMPGILERLMLDGAAIVHPHEEEVRP
jgi:branched-chain amino acid transport system ATP-binding protein